MPMTDFDFDVITGPSVPQDRKPDSSPPSPATTQPAAREPLQNRSR